MPPLSKDHEGLEWAYGISLLIFPIWPAAPSRYAIIQAREYS